jgi:hypothetical protein
MYRIMYMSTAIREFSNEELEDLLEIARKNNSELNVTGLLVIKGRTFLQCLEGDKKNVITIFEKIKKDHRHTEVYELIDEDAEERYFPDWSMGYKNIKYLTDIKSIKLKDFSQDSSSIDFTNDDILEVFKEFIESN